MVFSRQAVYVAGEQSVAVLDPVTLAPLAHHDNLHDRMITAVAISPSLDLLAMVGRASRHVGCLPISFLIYFDFLILFVLDWR